LCLKHFLKKKDNQLSLMLVSMAGCETLVGLASKFQLKIEKCSSLHECEEEGLMAQASVLGDAKLWLK
jgi:hypothetical protein